MSIRLQTTVLFVLNLDESRAFYEQVLGLKIQAAHETHVEYVGGISLWQVHHAYDVIFHRPATGLVQLGADNCELRFFIDDIEPLEQRVAASQLPVIKAPNGIESGPHLLRLYDPDRHIVEIEEMLPSGVILEIPQQRFILTAVDTACSHGIIMSEEEDSYGNDPHATRRDPAAGRV